MTYFLEIEINLIVWIARLVLAVKQFFNYIQTLERVRYKRKGIIIKYIKRKEKRWIEKREKGR